MLEWRVAIGGEAFAAVSIDDDGAAANDEAPIAGELASRTTSIEEERRFGAGGGGLLQKTPRNDATGEPGAADDENLHGSDGCP
jgi:hypothetical protein